MTLEASLKQSDSRSSAFRADIEGLRGVAILLVVLFHCDVSAFSGGFVGVDIFFVLSGFLITGILVREVQTTAQLNLLEFYARRARRLLPAFAITVITTLLVGVLILTPDELDLTARAARAAALHLGNMFFDMNSGDYFSPSVQSNPLLHTWSLAVEEQFYLFWPLLILIGSRWRQSTHALVPLLLGLTLISLGVGIALGGNTFAFYELPARAWEFGIGGLTWFLSQKKLQGVSQWGLTIGWCGFLAILSTTSLLSVTSAASFPGWIALIPTLGTAAILIAGTEYPSRGIGVLLTSWPLQRLGTVSYSWYLWHWPMLVFSAVLIPTLALPGKLAVIAISFVVAIVSHQRIERPIRYHHALLKRPALSVGLAAAVMVLSLSTAGFSIRYAADLAKDPSLRFVTSSAQSTHNLLIERKCTPPLQSPEVKLCQFGKETAQVHIILFGDSHAMQWFGPLKQIADLHDWKLTTVVKTSCPAFDIRPSTFRAEEIGQIEAYNEACSQWRVRALEIIPQQHPTLVVLGNATSHLGQNYEHLFASPAQPSLDELRDGVQQTLQALNSLSVVVMRDTPHFPYHVPTCVIRSIRSNRDSAESCSADQALVLNPEVHEVERAGARDFSNVHFVDMTDLFCQTGTCKPTHGPTVMYGDTDHVTINFTDQLMTALTTALQTILETHHSQLTNWSQPTGVLKSSPAKS